MPQTLICEVFRSSRREGMYLYVERIKGLRDVPDPLQDMFGTAESVMVFALKPERKLARAPATEVIEAINTQGYYLQTPPVVERITGVTDAD